MTCTPDGALGRRCDTHGLPLYPDGHCNAGRPACDAAPSVGETSPSEKCDYCKGLLPTACSCSSDAWIDTCPYRTVQKVPCACARPCPNEPLQKPPYRLGGTKTERTLYRRVYQDGVESEELCGFLDDPFASEIVYRLNLPVPRPDKAPT